jgi:Leucine-rich repeat (LRR) protein
MKTITNLKNTIMKKLLLLFVLFTGISATRAQYVVIPDPAFVTWLQNNGFSACLQGNQLDTTCSLVLNTTTLTIGNQKIYNLSGIQYFKNLTILDAQHDSIGIIPALPPVLENLDVEWNNLSSLPPLPPTLISLICGTNPFVTLPVLPASLKRLWCRGSFLSTMPALPDSIGDVDVANGQLNEIPYLPPALVYFDCSYNQITVLPIFRIQFIRLLVPIILI